MKSIASRGAFLIILLCGIAVTYWRIALRADNAEDHGTQAQSLASELLKGPGFLLQEIELGQPRLRQADDLVVPVLQAIAPQPKGLAVKLHGEVVFKSGKGVSPEHMWVRLEPVDNPPVVRVDPEIARKSAESFTERWIRPRWPSEYPLRVVSPGGPPTVWDGRYNRFDVLSEGPLGNLLRVVLEPFIWDGRLGQASVYIIPVLLKDIEPRLTEEQATRVAWEAGVAKNLLPAGEPARPVWIGKTIDHINYDWSKQVVKWTLKYYQPQSRWPSPTQPMLVYVSLDAQTGKVLDTMVTRGIPEVYEMITGERLPRGESSQQYGIRDEWPAFSPDGKQIVFVSDRLRDGFQRSKSQGRITLFMANLADGKLRALLDVAERTPLRPAFSPSGRHVVFDNAGNAGVGVLDLRTGTVKYYTTHPFQPNACSWSRTGDFLVAGGRDASGGWDILLIDLSSSRKPAGPTNTATATRETDERLPVCSPDGDTVAVAIGDSNPFRTSNTKGSIRLIRADGTVIRDLKSSFPMVTRLSWFPDGKRILVSYLGGVSVLDTEADLRNDMFADLTDPAEPKTGALTPMEATISPNGETIAFIANCPKSKSNGPGDQFVYLANIQGRSIRRLTSASNGRAVPLLVYPGVAAGQK